MKLFTPGPVAMDPQTIAEAGKQPQYFRTPEFSKILGECSQMLKTALDAPDSAKMIFLTASGTAAMEATVLNLFSGHDKIIIINGGSFGKRFKQICDIHRLNSVSINLEWNEPFAPDCLANYQNAGFTGMLVNMCETSTGQIYPMEIIADFCKKNNICLVVDAISSFLCDPLSMKSLGAGAVIVSSQKGLGLQPGMSFVALTEEMYRERCEKNEVKSLYFCFTDYAKDLVRGQTPYTPAVSIINQLYAKLPGLVGKGMEAHITYISKIATHLRERLAKTAQFTVPSYPLSNCLTPVYCGKNNAMEIVETLKRQHDVYVTPCAGSIASFLFRVAHMSRQITEEDIDVLAELLQCYEQVV